MPTNHSTNDTLPSLAGAPWLTAASTQRVMAAIAAGGFAVRTVGGVVRNALMGLAVTDIDIATTALPEDTMRLARAAGLGVAETGLQHGTVTVIAGRHTFEVTTLRRDVETHGRHAVVAFTDDWAADARRRDFTMNALYCDADGRVYDPLGSYPDLTARRVRFIGEAADRIAEDYLRILRFFRFTAQYAEGPPEASGLVACMRLREGLARLSKERIHQEMKRILVARRALEGVVAMHEHGILAYVVPAVPRPSLLRRLIEIETAQGLEPDAMLRLTALAVESPEHAQRLAGALKVSREERAVLELGGRVELWLVAAPQIHAARVLLYRLGPADYRRIITLSWARALAASVTDGAWSETLELPQRWVAPELPVNGTDVMARGVAAGRPVGDALRALEAWWIEKDFQPSRDELLARIRG